MIDGFKGFSMKRISRKKMNNTAFLQELRSAGISDDVPIHMTKTLESGGYVYAWYKKKALAALYIAEKEASYIPEVKPYETTDEKGNKKKVNGHKAYTAFKLSCAFINKDFENVKDKFDEDVLEDLKEKVIFSDVDKVIEWNGRMIYQEKVRVLGLSIAIYPLALSLGVMYGVVFDNIVYGLLIGSTVGIILSLFGIGGKSTWNEMDVSEENKQIVSDLM